MNPLLDFSGLPRFDAVTPAHVAPAIDELLAANRSLIERLAAAETPATWNDFVQPMIDAGEQLSRAWGIVGHLHSVNDVPEWRDAYNAMLPEVSRFYAELGQNLALFDTRSATSACRAPNCPRTASRASRPSRRNSPRWRPSSPRTCSTPPTPTPSG